MKRAATFRLHLMGIAVVSALTFGAQAASAQVIRLSDNASYSGANKDIITEVPDLSTIQFADKASSATVMGGPWLACQGPYFSGACVVLRESSAMLGMYGMSDSIKSIRPLPDGITLEHGTVFSRDSLGQIIYYRPTGESTVTPIGGGTAAPAPAPSTASQQPPSVYAQKASPAGAGVEYEGPDEPEVILYTDRNYKGKALGLDRDVSRLSSLYFDNQISSIEILRGEWEICDYANYQGTCKILDYDQESLWQLEMDNKTSSIRQRPDGTKFREDQLEERRREQDQIRLKMAMDSADLIMYEHGNFKGDPLPTKKSMESLGPFNDRASSFKVLRGKWLFCTDGNFRGQCVEANSSVSDMNSLGINDKVSSVKRVN